ncbi:MAG: hypothetical protein EAZ74_04070 [Alphaproteobacteria bacterium]|nr:MAG: hypothetical protein EAY76_04065 [Alphaproteobacteria bacterium]TAF14416.1 MAG: hypothetical protein EAZ74_04070 [Alphaproteobacteria bacterium]TAF39576.1 MAG: hypothetical protein EAZ66_04620 [Alphaproteobacteria bacterium]TAF77561.1 MAG: hypothetical protein EAZ52_00200 [Alphaproteobacteria bacterium]
MPIITLPPQPATSRSLIPRELASKGDGSLLVNHDAIARLERMREIIDAPLIITSAYRDPLHNAK